MPIIDIGAPGYVKATPNFSLVTDPQVSIINEARLIVGEPYLLTDSTKAHDDGETSQLDQFAALVLDKDALVRFCGPSIIEKWDHAAALVNIASEELPGINIDHLFVKHLGIILQEDTEEPCIAIEESENTPARVAAQQAILKAYGELMSAIILGVGKTLFKTPGYEDLATQIDYMAHILKRRNFPCFGTEENAWWNNLTIHTSTEMMDITRDRGNFNGAVPVPALFMQGSGTVYFSRFAQVYKVKPYSVILIGGAEQVVVSACPAGETKRVIALGRCEEDVFRHYAQYDPLNQMRDRLAQEMTPK
ncbi:protein of unknown function [Taphrina deformans PYCC 5710]|uniref:Uncharacterized protein n=1 Tax=Taphrina deformans (strain PYCC 5710 / ATCC 11124 / CBS 356.35 / IMI 108563 / JCM 9778 / NBRC 8474) TaxID=1097556 RepID=R4XD81_TAPDE|nr:protein of unknown function [Taphrina deformans PYCC 5710]|eukprot:CCG82363.1 protein of unknown function [Taphrina deformans PYCC 5710]